MIERDVGNVTRYRFMFVTANTKTVALSTRVKNGKKRRKLKKEHEIRR